MWWLSQAKLKDVLNRWICSSFQPVSAQNIPHLDPRGSWKHFCGTPGDLNCTLLIYRTICKRYSSKKRPRWEKRRDSPRTTRGRGAAPSARCELCLQQRLVHEICCKNPLIVTEHNIWRDKLLSLNCPRVERELQTQVQEGGMAQSRGSRSKCQIVSQTRGKGQASKRSGSAHGSLC